MNRYGQLARKHWQDTAPERYAALPDPEEFFSTMGDEVESRVQELATALAGLDPTGEGYLEKVGRLNMARLQAEEAALAELVWLVPSEGGDDGHALSSVDEFMKALHDADPDAT